MFDGGWMSVNGVDETAHHIDASVIIITIISVLYRSRATTVGWMDHPET